LFCYDIADGAHVTYDGTVGTAIDKLCFYLDSEGSNTMILC